MAYLQLTLESDPESAARIAELLELFSALSVSLSARSDEDLFATETTTALKLWRRTRISALLHEDTDLDVLLACLRKRVGAEKIDGVATAPAPRRDWVNQQRAGRRAKFFGGGRLCVRPSWLPPSTAAADVMLDPGLAFGSGDHATTAACLDWLAGRELRGKTVIDYGCGSGILALAAVALGARRVYAVDIDPQALWAAQENAKKNAAGARLVIAHVDKAALPAADVLLANILLGPLCELAPKFSALLKDGGELALSGLLATQAETCRRAYQPWFDLGAPLFSDTWCLLRGVKRAADCRRSAALQ